MKIIRILMLSFAVLSCFIAHADKQNRIIIVNGQFFNEIPAVVKNSTSLGNLNMFIIKTPNETNAIEYIILQLNSQKML